MKAFVTASFDATSLARIKKHMDVHVEDWRVTKNIFFDGKQFAQRLHTAHHGLQRVTQHLLLFRRHLLGDVLERRLALREEQGEEIVERALIAGLFDQRGAQGGAKGRAIMHANGFNAMRGVHTLGQRYTHASGAQRADEIHHSLIHNGEPSTRWADAADYRDMVDGGQRVRHFHTTCAF